MRRIVSLLVVLHFTLAASLDAQVPQMINYQGRVVVGGTNFTGTGQFKFALVDGAATTFWSNGTAAVSLTVTNGLYSVLLGDAGMNPVPYTVFTNGDVRLRVWFDDGVHGSQLFSPDQRIASVGYAHVAAMVMGGSGYSGSSVPNMQLFVSDGIFTNPVGVTRIMVEIWGGGGGGGSGGGLIFSGGGGGAGGYGRQVFSVTPGSTYAVTCGAGGLSRNDSVGRAF